MGFPYASFLLGLVNNGTVNQPAALRTGKHFIALFAQDSWKATNKLRLEFGIRHSIIQPYYSLWRNMAVFDPASY